MAEMFTSRRFRITTTTTNTTGGSSIYDKPPKQQLYSHQQQQQRRRNHNNKKYYSSRPPMSPPKSPRSRSTSPVRRLYGRIPTVITCRVPDRIEGYLLGTTVGNVDNMDGLDWGVTTTTAKMTTKSCSSSSSSHTDKTMTMSEELKLHEEEEQQKSDRNELMMCLNLLESNLLGDNRYGMERLMKLVNSQLVNGISKDGSVAEALVCTIHENDDDDDEDDNKTKNNINNDKDSNKNSNKNSLVQVSKRLQQVFLSYLSNDCDCDSISDFSDSTHTDDDDDESDDDSYSSSSSSCSSCSSFGYDNDLPSELKIIGGKHKGALKLPALRILASALESLVNDFKNDNKNKKNVAGTGDVAPTIDVTSCFWKQLLLSISSIVEVTTLYRIEATFSLRCIRLIRQLQSREIDSYIKYTLLPYILHARDYGVTKKDKILIRESQSLLKPFCI